MQFFKKWDNDKKISVIASIMSVALGILFGFYIMLLLDKPSALVGIRLLFAGAFMTGFKGLSDILLYSVPVIMTGLSVSFGFKCGLFNIGASGQFCMGGLAAIIVGVHCVGLHPILHFILATLAAALVGGIWGFIPGILKAKCDVNEVIATLLLNYVSLYMSNYIIQMLVYDMAKNRNLPVAVSANLPAIVIGNARLSIGIILALLLAFTVHFILEKTTFGYELKICGRNKFASQYSGMHEQSLIIQAMTIAGILSGLGGAFFYLSGQGVFMQVSESVVSQGFDGLSVALVAMSSPLGVIIIALFLGYIHVGGSMLQIAGFSHEVVNMIIASIVYCGALVLPFKKVANSILISLNKKKGD